MQKLRLQREGQVADLVEEDRAVVRLLELPLLSLMRAGERASLVPQQLGLEQSRWDRGAIDFDKRPLIA